MGEGAIKACDVCRGEGSVLTLIERAGSHPGNHMMPCPACVPGADEAMTIRAQAARAIDIIEGRPGKSS
jgi:hypothetical protein